MDVIVGDRFRIDHKIAQGAFAFVYGGIDNSTQEKVAIKLRLCKAGDRDMVYESKTYPKLGRGTGIPKLLWNGVADEFSAMVMQPSLGPTLQDLLQYCGGKFSLKTVLMIADQGIRRLRFIHRKGFLHCDIKTDNLAMGSEKDGNVLYVVDFGVGRNIDEATGVGEWDVLRPPGGPPLFATHLDADPFTRTRATDLEEFGHVLIYLLKGSLPWEKGIDKSDASGETEMAKEDINIKERKAQTTVDELCKDLPAEFAKYMTYTRTLPAEKTPNYAHLLRLFSNLFSDLGFQHDNVFDWTEKLFNELQKDQPASPSA